MAKIEWHWFMIVGSIVFAVSWFNRKMFLFLFIGAGFLIYGFFRFLGRKSGVKPQPPQYLMDNARSVPHYRLCHNCGAHLHLHDNFCHRCGINLSAFQRKPI